MGVGGGEIVSNENGEITAVSSSVSSVVSAAELVSGALWK